MIETFKHLLATSAKLIGTADRAASDAVIIKSGNASSGDSGAIVLRPGTAVGLRGKILLEGDTEIGGTTFPSSTGASGQWMIANGSGAATWTSPEESGAVPAGTIMPFAGINCPTGWFFCDGTTKDRIVYARLWNALKKLPDGSTGGVWDRCYDPQTNTQYPQPAGGEFRLPDFRGAFMRGAGTPTGLDAVTLAGWQLDKTKKNSLSVSGGTASLTGTTTFAANGHTHAAGSNMAARIWINSSNNTHMDTRTGLAPWNADAVCAGSAVTLATGYTSGAIVVGDTGSNNAAATVGISSTGASISDGDTETRPRNVGVNYIIKY